MATATAARLAKSYGAERVFADVSFEIQAQDRIALVGVNGSGKSTLLRILAGLDRPDHGALSIAGGARVGYLPQEVTFPAGKTLREHVLGAFEHLLAIEAKLCELEDELARGDANEARLQALLEQHARLEHQYEYDGGYSYENRMREVLAGLGIEEHRLDQPLETFSGGQRTRVALAERLLVAQDLLLLDEPTNHLDLAALEWLEDYLAKASQAIVAVSHDRYFLDKVATRVWELSFGKLETYTGNYSQYAAQRTERQLRLQREYEAQQEHIARTEAFIRRYRAGQRYRQARGRQKQLDRLERIGRPREVGRMRLTIGSTLRSGDTVLALEDLVVGAATAPGKGLRAAPGAPVVLEATRGRVVPAEMLLFRCPEVELRRGERAAIVGPNGTGKTTLLRVLVGEQEPAAGRVYVGHGVQVAYYAQAHEQLDPSRTVLQEILAAKPMGEEAARTYLGRFLFSGDDAFKLVSSLSGGERSRLALVKLALSNANVLVLDEPTNHLDIDARDALEETLSAFEGTILFVSHDRYLIDSLATHVWEVAAGALTVHEGTWSEFVEERRRLASAQEATVEAVRAAASRGADAAAHEARAHSRRLAAQRQRLERLEAEIGEVEGKVQVLAAEIEVASAAANATLIADLGRQHEMTATQLAQLEDEWLALREAIECAETAARPPLDTAPTGGYRSA
ncbi:MAG: ABC-F family ATP-binding cassette domain-containing protein [Chloroflexi bacterium]|nr:ABC-F family ATP-binding cassette domain-containing protein [Chloroflexota bacterium]